jgi:hypothetical protein
LGRSVRRKERTVQGENTAFAVTESQESEHREV